MSTFDPYHKWLGIPPAEQPPHHYRLLGVAPFESDPEVIEAAADRQMSYIRQCATGPYTKESQQILNELSAARVCLLNPAKKAAYDRELNLRLAPLAATPEPRPAVSRPRVTRIPANRKPADDDDEFSMILLQRSVADGEITLPPRQRRYSKKRTPSNVYWLWGGAGGVGLLLVWGLILLVSQSASVLKPDLPIATPETPFVDDLLKRVTLNQNTVRGVWSSDGAILVSPATQFALLQVPVTPPKSYTLGATVEATDIHDCLAIGLVTGSTQVTVILNGWSGTTSGLQLVDLKMVPANETKFGPVLVPDEPNQIVCTVIPGQIEVTCNGKRVVNWKGDFNRLLAGPDWEPPNKRQLYLGTNGTSYRISNLELQPMPGGAQVPTNEPSAKTGGQPDAAAAREVVKRALRLKAELAVTPEGSGKWINVKKIEDLPAGAFRFASLGFQWGTAADLQSLCAVRIEQLHLTGKGITDDHLAALSKARSIGTLRVEKTSCTDAGLAHLAKCPDLQMLLLYDDAFSPAGWKHLQDIPTLSDFRAGGRHVTGAHVEALAASPALKFVTFSDCQFTGYGFRAFRGKPQMVSLTFMNCPFNEALMRAIGDGLPDLKRLEVSSPSSSGALNDATLSSLTELKQLQTLHLGNSAVTDAGLATIAQLDGLTSLMLNGAAVTGTGFQAHTGKLQELQYCFLNQTRLTDEGLQHLAAAAPKIENLYIVATAVTDKGLKQLPALKGLKVVYLSKGVYSDAALDDLRKALPNCNVNLQ